MTRTILSLFASLSLILPSLSAKIPDQRPMPTSAKVCFGTAAPLALVSGAGLAYTLYKDNQLAKQYRTAAKQTDDGIMHSAEIIAADADTPSVQPQYRVAAGGATQGMAIAEKLEKDPKWLRSEEAASLENDILGASAQLERIRRGRKRNKIWMKASGVGLGIAAAFGLGGVASLLADQRKAKKEREIAAAKLINQTDKEAKRSSFYLTQQRIYLKGRKSYRHQAVRRLQAIIGENEKSATPEQAAQLRSLCWAVYEKLKDKQPVFAYEALAGGTPIDSEEFERDLKKWGKPDEQLLASAHACRNAVFAKRVPQSSELAKLRAREEKLDEEKDGAEILRGRIALYRRAKKEKNHDVAAYALVGGKPIHRSGQGSEWIKLTNKYPRVFEDLVLSSVCDDLWERAKSLPDDIPSVLGDSFSLEWDSVSPEDASSDKARLSVFKKNLKKAQEIAGLKSGGRERKFWLTLSRFYKEEIAAAESTEVMDDAYMTEAMVRRMRYARALGGIEKDGVEAILLGGVGLSGVDRKKVVSWYQENREKVKERLRAFMHDPENGRKFDVKDGVKGELKDSVPGHQEFSEDLGVKFLTRGNGKVVKTHDGTLNSFSKKMGDVINRLTTQKEGLERGVLARKMQSLGIDESKERDREALLYRQLHTKHLPSIEYVEKDAGKLEKELAKKEAQFRVYLEKYVDLERKVRSFIGGNLAEGKGGISFYRDKVVKVVDVRGWSRISGDESSTEELYENSAGRKVKRDDLPEIKLAKGEFVDEQGFVCCVVSGESGEADKKQVIEGKEVILEKEVLGQWRVPEDLLARHDYLRWATKRYSKQAQEALTILDRWSKKNGNRSSDEDAAGGDLTTKQPIAIAEQERLNSILADMEFVTGAVIRSYHKNGKLALSEAGLSKDLSPDEVLRRNKIASSAGEAGRIEEDKVYRFKDLRRGLEIRQAQIRLGLEEYERRLAKLELKHGGRKRRAETVLVQEVKTQEYSEEEAERVRRELDPAYYEDRRQTLLDIKKQKIADEFHGTPEETSAEDAAKFAQMQKDKLDEYERDFLDKDVSKIPPQLFFSKLLAKKKEEAEKRLEALNEEQKGRGKGWLPEWKVQQRAAEEISKPEQESLGDVIEAVDYLKGLIRSKRKAIEEFRGVERVEREA